MSEAAPLPITETVVLRGEYIVAIKGVFYSEYYRYGVWHDTEGVYRSHVEQCATQGAAYAAARAGFARLVRINPEHDINVLHNEYKRIEQYKGKRNAT